MTRLSDTQLVILSAAANHDDGSIFPFPDTLIKCRADATNAGPTQQMPGRRNTAT